MEIKAEKIEEITKSNFSSELKRVRDLLRLHKENPEVDNKTKGLIGNILGELNKLEYQEKNKYGQILNPVLAIIHEYESDPVIKTYLATKEDWTDKYNNLKALTRNKYDGWDEDE